MNIVPSISCVPQPPAEASSLCLVRKTAPHLIQCQNALVLPQNKISFRHLSI